MPRAPNTYSSTVPAYRIAGIRVEAVNRLNRALVFSRSTRTIAPETAHTARVAQVGPPVALGTLRSSWWPGRRRSRDMEKASRELVTMITRPQAKIDTQMNTRKTFSMLVPSVSRRMKATGAASALAAATSRAASMPGPSQAYQPGLGTRAVDHRFPQWASPTRMVAPSRMIASSTMPMNSVTTATVLIRVVIGVDQTITAACSTITPRVMRAALVG